MRHGVAWGRDTTHDQPEQTMRDFRRTTFAVVVAGFALVATLDVRHTYAQEQPSRLINTLCGQGVLTVCGETTEYICPQGGGISYTYPYTVGITLTQPVCYPVNKTSKFKDFISNTPTIVITAPRPSCTTAPKSGTPDEDAGDGSTSDEESCTE
jgi:hypothetical protein